MFFVRTLDNPGSKPITTSYPLVLYKGLGLRKAPVASGGGALPVAVVQLSTDELIAAGADDLDRVQADLIVPVVPGLRIEPDDPFVVRAIQGCLPVTPMCRQMYG